MIVGLNRVVEHQGRQFHVQVEDLGEAQACFVVRLHEGGGIVWKKQVDYRDAVRTSMEKTLHTVVAAIARGKLP